MSDNLQLILRAVQEFDISVSRATELIEIDQEGKFNYDLLPYGAGTQAIFGFDEVPVQKYKELLAERDSLVSTERRLRRMLCLRCHGTAAHLDDEEAAFGGDKFQRLTDYLRELLDSIQQAWVDAVMKEAASTLGDLDGWTPWAGGECPVDSKSWVEVKLRSGSAWIDKEAQMGADWLWDHDGGPDDIIAYRVVK